MARFYAMSELPDEPVFIPFPKNQIPLDADALSAEDWRDRYSAMRQEFQKYLWAYSPVCSKRKKMVDLLRHLCVCALEMQDHPQKNAPLERVRDMDLVLGMISQEEYDQEVQHENAEELKFALRDRHANQTLDDICGEILRNAGGKEGIFSENLHEK
ncbi:MAG: hypothetical protein J6A23_12610 [Thermoguttaceae bacterium]|nr:hypothetical protein [Thermoguttaceae bacterium]MBP3693355.1 hypothetical protein [Thermoguttaceae bacterium]